MSISLVSSFTKALEAIKKKYEGKKIKMLMNLLQDLFIAKISVNKVGMSRINWEAGIFIFMFKRLHFF